MAATASWRLLDQAEGRIARIGMAIPAFAAKSLAAALPGLIARLPEAAALDIMTEPAALADVRRWTAVRATPVRLHAAPDGIAFTNWLQDPAVVAVRAGAPVIITP